VKKDRIHFEQFVYLLNVSLEVFSVKRVYLQIISNLSKEISEPKWALLSAAFIRSISLSHLWASVPISMETYRKLCISFSVIAASHLPWIIWQTYVELESQNCCVKNIINFVKSRPLNSRIFSVLCDELGGSYTVLLYMKVR
jgi:hypothetical protein